MNLDLERLFSLAAGEIATWAPKAAGALAVLVGGFVVARWIRRGLRKALERSHVDPVLVPFLTGMAYVALIAMVTIAAIGVLGVSAASFVAVLGAAGLAIALAFQGTFSNFAAGVMLLTFKPFKVADFVEVGGQSGSVTEVGIFSTVLTTSDGLEVRIPNSEVFGKTMKNYTANPTRRIDLVVGVSYDDDLATTIRTCQDVLASDPRVLADPAALVAVDELADSSVNLVVRPWVKTEDYWTARRDLIRALKEALEGAGLTIPYPQRDVHVFQEVAKA